MSTYICSYLSTYVYRMNFTFQGVTHRAERITARLKTFCNWILYEEKQELFGNCRHKLKNTKIMRVIKSISKLDRNKRGIYV